MRMVVSESKMEKVGIEVLNGRSVWLKCKKCGLSFSPNFLSGGRLPRGYWKCPHGCNETALQDYNKAEILFRKKLTAEAMIPYLPTAKRVKG